MFYSRRRLLQLTGSLAAGASLARPGEAAPEEVPPAIAALTPRLEGVTPITLEERRARVRRAQQLMVGNRLDALVMASGSSLLYFTGARWGLDSAEAVLRLRALRGNGDLDDYIGYHIQQEKHRNHDSRYQQTCDLAA